VTPHADLRFRLSACWCLYFHRLISLEVGVCLSKYVGLLLLYGDVAQACCLIGVVTSRLTCLAEVMLDVIKASGYIVVVIVPLLSIWESVILLQLDNGIIVS